MRGRAEGLERGSRGGWRRRFGCLTLLLAASTSCHAERDRLDVPQLELRVDQETVPRGGSVSGRAVATDRSGIVYLRVFAFSVDDTSRSPSPNFFGEESVNMPFALRVSCTAANQSLVIVEARAIDSQDFDAVQVDTVRINGGVCPP